MEFGPFDPQPSRQSGRRDKLPYETTLAALFKTVREIALERKVADLERALFRAKYGAAENIMMTPTTVEVTHEYPAPQRFVLPKVGSIETRHDEGMPHHVGVAAMMWVPQPFALNYYCDLSLLADLRIATQVLGMMHERFVHQLADLSRRTGEMPISKKAPTASPRVPSTS